MNLANLGLSGMLAAQNRLQTTGHNINNADTEGYNRQTVLTQTAGSVNYGAGFIGRGVQGVTVQRAYDNFLVRQLVEARSQGEGLKSYSSQISQVDNLFSDRTVGVSPAIQKFFDGLQAVATEPADPAARQELLGRSASLVSQFNDANRFLDEQRENVNNQIDTVVRQINSYAERVQDLNQQIRIARASGNQHEPNDLLDQRDQLFAELNELVDVRASEQDGNLNLILGSGQVLLGASNVYPLATQPAADDPRRLAVAYTLPSAPGNVPTTVEVEEHRITGGQLGGLLQYRREALDPAQNELGRVAIGLGRAINHVHAQGEDLHNQTGADFFNVGGPRVIPHGSNDANSPNLAVAFHSINGLTGQDYRIEADTANGQFLVTRLPDNVQLGPLADNQVHTLDGLQITLPDISTVEQGDSWLVQPTRGAAGEISLALSDPASIAAADPGTGSANGENALRLAALQSEKTLGGGAMSFNEAFSQLVNRVGVLTQQNATALKAQDSLIQQNYAAQQAVSGVNLDEEYVYLDRYQEQFRAAARLIDVSSTLFDTVLGLRA